MFEHNALALAAERRRNLFAVLTDDIGSVVTANPLNAGYLSGYFSMSNDTSALYRSAAIATREGVVLVVSAADAGPALERLGDTNSICRYGTFYFEATGEAQGLGYDVPGFADFESALGHAIERHHPKSSRLGIDAPDARSCTFASVLSPFSSDRIASVSATIAELRRIKLLGEIERIRHATRLVERGIVSVRQNLAVGMTECEIAGLVATAMVSGGGVPRFISVTSGPRSALADAYPTNRRVQKGELIRLDAGCVVEGFCSDMARTFVIGEPDTLARKRYDAIAIGLEDELEAVKAGIQAVHLFETAVASVRANGIESYRRHHCGHGLGIGGYEHPIIAKHGDLPLQKDMCLCVETPYYRIGWGGIMVEDTILVTDTGYDPITTIARELICV